MWQIMVFFLGALAIAALSFRHFSRPESEGFLRTLAILALWASLVISLPWWSRDVLSIRQIISWIALAAGLILAISALSLLLTARSHGGKTPGPRLVTSGPYRYIRHPLYASMILIAWGLALKSGSWLAALSSLAATGFLYLTARREEDTNFDRFGEEYERYLAATRMFVPGLF